MDWAWYSSLLAPYLKKQVNQKGNTKAEAPLHSLRVIGISLFSFDRKPVLDGSDAGFQSNELFGKFTFV